MSQPISAPPASAKGEPNSPTAQAVPDQASHGDQIDATINAPSREAHKSEGLATGTGANPATHPIAPDHTQVFVPSKSDIPSQPGSSKGSLGFSVGPAQGAAGEAADDMATRGFLAQPVLDGAPRVGSVGPYEILGELGRGGMGVVYKARHKQLGRIVALKMIRSAAHANHEQVERFLIEAQAVAKLQHPGIVQIFDIGQEEGLPYFSLEFVEGTTLEVLIHKQPLEPDRAARFAADLAHCVAFAHAAGVLHRDIKPGNVLVAAGDLAKLTDFGLAKQVREGASSLQTEEGTILGTPSFMSPEQARGDTSAIGPVSDQYSLGGVLYHMLTGRPPFMAARPLDTVMQVLHQEPVAPRQLQPTIPTDLETICLKALAKEPARRYADCAELAADLQRFLRREPILARPVGPAERLWRWCRRNPRIAVPLATAAASVLLALVISVWSAFSLAAKNRDLDVQRGIAVEARQKADENARLAEENAKQADANAQTAYRRAVEAKDSVAKMLFAIRRAIPVTEEKLRPVREQLMKVASEQLERLPDSAADYELSTGLEKARLLELQYTTSLELGEPSKAIEHLEKAEAITRERNAAQHTDATRFNLMTVLLYHAQARQTVRRDMELAREKGDESVRLLEDILAHPNPAEFNAEKGSMKRLDMLTQMFVATYQYARTLRKLGRVGEALAVIEQGLTKFDPAMEILRAGPPFNDLSAEQWDAQKQAFRGMLADQDQLHALLLLSAGRADEALAKQDRILLSARQAVEQDGSPGKFGSRQKLVQCLYFAGDVAKARGDGDAARELYAEAMKLARELYDDNPQLELRRNDLNICLVRLAGLLREKEPARAAELYREALTIARDMVQADDQGETKHVAVALALPFTGDHVEAAKLAESILKRAARPDAELQIDMARTYCGCAWAARASDPAAAEQYRTRAIELLAAAVEGGYRDRAYLSNHPDYDPLRESEGFQALLAK